MSVPSRVLAILDLYVSGKAEWTVEEMAEAIGVSTSTAYRYTKELCAAGFLDPISRSKYALGPAFIQYDYLLRADDPLIRHATPIMQDMIARTDPRIDIVLSRLFNNCVLCIHQENGPMPHPPTSYARGVAMPLFVGATSKVILAHMPDRALRRLYLEMEDLIKKTLPAQTWSGLKEELKHIRKQGFCLTTSEVTKSRVGIAAPVFREGAIVASLSIVMEITVFEELSDTHNVSEIIRQAASQISKGLSQDLD